MITLPPLLKSYLANHPKPVIPSHAVDRAETELDFKLAREYREFVESYGCIQFGQSDEVECAFEYSASIGTKRQAISFLHDIETLPLIHKNMTTDDPSYPAEFVCVGSDAGQGCVLLEISSGRVFYWPENDSRWGESGNDQIYLVAENFAEFISALKLWS